MWATWLFFGIIGLLVLLVVGSFLALLVSALIERHHVRELVPVSEEQAPSSATARRIGDEATRSGLLFVGVFRHTGSALLRTTISFYLSEDRIVMMTLPSHTVALGYRLYSRMADDVWLVSGEVPGGAAELSRYRMHEHLPGCSLGQVMAFHRDRVATYGHVAVPFSLDTIVHDLHTHDRGRAEDVIASGYGRWVDAAQTIWRFNLRGACRLIAMVLQHHTRLNKEASDLSARYKELPEC